MKTKIRRAVAAYYSEALRNHGPTPAGVDWSSAASQELRFAKLSGIFPPAGPFSVLDFGCGYGAYLPWLRDRGTESDYAGFDISTDMIATARSRFPDARWTQDSRDLTAADYVIASGIFNVMAETPIAEWEAWIEEVLSEIDGLARSGFAFNMLTSYSDEDKMKDTLYYADPGRIFDHCKRQFSRKVALLHDYDLYEFTIHVRKDG